MKISIALLLLLLFYTPKTFAHPGRTAADGCHYCRTNCDSWGVPWNERHCHGGGDPDPIYESAPYVPLPTKKLYIPPTRIPTRRPTITPSPIPILEHPVKPVKKKVAKNRKTPKKSFWRALLGGN